MAFDNLTDSQVRDIAGSVNTFFDVNQVKAMLEVADAIAGGAAGSVAWANVTGKPNATTSVRGLVLQGAAVPNAAAAPTQAEFNALVAALRAAGIIAP